MSNQAEIAPKPYHELAHRGLVFYGPSVTGKTKKAREIAATYSYRHVDWISAMSVGKKRIENRISKCYKYCESPELIVIDDIPSIVPIEFFYQFISDGITVQLLDRLPYKVYPKIILIYLEDATRDNLERCPSDSRRFDYVDFSSAQEVETIDIKNPFRLICTPDLARVSLLTTFVIDTPKIGRSFHLSEAENQRFLDWSKSLPEMRTGPIRGEYSFIFTPTTMGDTIHVRRSDGQEIDLTDYDSF